jgi:hypothetical protein
MTEETPEPSTVDVSMGETVCQAVQTHLANANGDDVGMLTGFVGLVTAQHLDGTTSWWHIGMPGQDDLRSDELARRLHMYAQKRVDMIMSGIIYGEEEGDEDDD